MASNRIGRINEEIRQELAELIRNLKDPRVQQSMVSVTAVETTPDLRYAKVFISVLDKDRTQETLKGLKSAGGWLRRELGARLRLRCTPEPVFVEDTSIGYGAHIADLLASLNIPKEEPQNDDPGNG